MIDLLTYAGEYSRAPQLLSSFIEQPEVGPIRVGSARTIFTSIAMSYVKPLLEAERGELTALDQEVLESLRQQEILSRNPEEELQAGLTAG